MNEKIKDAIHQAKASLAVENLILNSEAENLIKDKLLNKITMEEFTKRVLNEKRPPMS